MMKRAECLQQLINCKVPLSKIDNELSKYPWDCDEPLVVLKAYQAKNVLRRFLLGELEVGDIIDWANMIEGRDDIDFDPNHEKLLKELMHELANPNLTNPLTQSSALRWVKLLEMAK